MRAFSPEEIAYMTDERRPAIEPDRLVLVQARLEHRAPRTELEAGAFEVGEDLFRDTAPAHLWFDKHALDLDGGRVEQANRAAPDRASIDSRHQERPETRRHLRGLEVRSAPLFSGVPAREVRLGPLDA